MTSEPSRERHFFDLLIDLYSDADCELIEHDGQVYARFVAITSEGRTDRALMNLNVIAAQLDRRMK
jgi:hypothetical protein